MPCSSRILSEMLPKIHTMEKCDFPKTYSTFSNNLISYIICLPGRQTYSKQGVFEIKRIYFWKSFSYFAFRANQQIDGRQHEKSQTYVSYKISVRIFFFFFFFFEK